MKLGYFLSSEEFGPLELVAQAVQAQEAGFEDLWISDHFHPWNDEQGHSGFVWATIGAIAQAAPGMGVTTAVTCPTVRTHPAVIAQAAATAAVLLGGRFVLGVGTGEALNEHILGDRWPSAPERREMLEEAVSIIRQLWLGGVQSHRGKHYQVDRAQVYDLPEQLPKILVSGFGPRSVELAAKIGDGFVTVEPDTESVAQFRAQAKRGQLVGGGLKVCYDADEQRARETAYRLWPNEALPGELAQILPTPAHFEQACELVSQEVATENVPCGPDPEHHIAAIRAYEEAGFDELYVQQIGPNQDAFFEAYREHVLPHFDADRQLTHSGGR
ncbi:MAG TPA: TIGR03557 family F420-dependent LLM class oxidoreductase [Solirubrobacteraceae bacterium]|jgi:G6PDH family F420-dependent oxidoreductase|nr:TIGR03557 family F420-dependent LLM class oxidoreductase [Solirubrobacteraceae bacterium]